MKQLILIGILFVVSVFAKDVLAGNAPKAYPKGGLGEVVKLGEDILINTSTHRLTKEYVGNTLSCTSCHIVGVDGKPGSSLGQSTFIKTAISFPAYSAREKTVVTLEDRSNNCFMRSMAGKKLPSGSEASTAIATYITWLSTGFAINMNEKGPWAPSNQKTWLAGQAKFAKIQKKATNKNYLAGKKIYEDKCAACHDLDGKGVDPLGPALWGFDESGRSLSYNTGAGLSKLNKVPVWIQSNMPKYIEGSLSDQEAADVGLYIVAQPRADFDLQKGLEGVNAPYNSKVLSEKHSVKSNFEAFGLDLDKIKK
ncbi:MAG: c-type cytochrome [Sulfurospirillum sp.]|nr:c-type cytochrome [Sulfurospirillum sp.]